jgi:hypothetical protein
MAVKKIKSHNDYTEAKLRVENQICNSGKHIFVNF